MTNTVTSANGSQTARNRATNAPAKNRHRRAQAQADWHRRGAGLLTPIVGQEFLDKYSLRDPLNRTLRYGVKTVFSTAGATAASSSASRTCAAEPPG